MLEPQGRQHLVEALRPPVGYELDRALGTTFSLDLLALLAAPLAFTVFDWEAEEARTGGNPLALLETMRRYADRISLFCQAGQITPPRKAHLLYGYLEGSVFEVTAGRRGGAFHPKVWALRFTAPEGPVLYRFLCLSRNMTFDRSWDTVLTLEGELTDRRNAFSANHPLGDFFAALPSLALRPLPGRVQETVDLVQHELRRVDFEVPEGFDSVAFWPLGLRGRGEWPFGGRVDRMLVVSPFASEGLVRRLPGRNGGVFVSRLETAERLDPASLEDFERVYVLRPEAEPEEGPEEDLAEDSVEDEAAEDQEEVPTEDGELPLSGLHAKLYVADAGRYARVWTGSANATNAAFGSNVEFLVELRGRKNHCGIGELMNQPRGVPSFADLLQEYTPDAGPPPVDPLKERLEGLAEEARRALSAVRLTAEVVSIPGEEELFGIRLEVPEAESLEWPPEVSVRSWPITLPARSEGLAPGTGQIASLGPLSAERITSFIAFEATATSGEVSAKRRFVLNVPLEGAPADRRERILRSLLDRSDKVLRLILLLLAEDRSDDYEAVLEIRRWLEGSGGRGGHRTIPSGIPLFEEMVLALGRNGETLDRVARLIEDLRKTEDGRRLMPEGLEEIWEPIWAARQRSKR